LLRATVREAGALALSLFRTELKNWIKGASSPVSEADIAVNDLLEQRLRSATPEYGWLSEESADDEERLGRRLVWIVDPIDGTRAYLAGREDWCVSVALVKDAAPLLAVTDLLVDGRFDRDRPEPPPPLGRRWIGSTNQTMHFLTSAYAADDARMRGDNTIEIRWSPSGLLINGWPVASGLVGRRP